MYTSVKFWLGVYLGIIQSGPRKSSPPSILHVSLVTELISVLTLCYGPGQLFRGQTWGWTTKK